MAQKTELKITRIDARSGAFESDLNEVRRQLSPSGNVVSPKGRELTLRVFGEALTPVAVVERICSAVKMRG